MPTLVEQLEAIYRDGGKASAKDLGLNPFDKLNEAAREFARARAAELVGKKWVDTGTGFELVDNPDARWTITEPTRERLNQLVTRAFNEGMDPEDLRQSILESGEFTPARAKAIADTELATAQEYGSLRTWAESGVVQKKGWMISGDHVQPDECDDNEAAGEIPIEQAFPSGHMAPPAHVHCWCSTYAVVE